MISMEASDLREILRAAESAQPIKSATVDEQIARLQTLLLRTQHIALDRGLQIAELQGQIASLKAGASPTPPHPIPFPNLETPARACCPAAGPQ